MTKETKSATLLLRMRPDVKAAGHEAAEQSNRSLSSLIETLLIQHCRELGLLPAEGVGRPRGRK
jgi:hypothetical protein